MSKETVASLPFFGLAYLCAESLASQTWFNLFRVLLVLAAIVVPFFSLPMLRSQFEQTRRALARSQDRVGSGSYGFAITLTISYVIVSIGAVVTCIPSSPLFDPKAIVFNLFDTLAGSVMMYLNI